MSIRNINTANMCCDRCITAVKEVFDMLEIKYQKIERVYATIIHDDKKSDLLEENLQKLGFEIIKSKEENISEKIKITIHKLFVETKLIDLNGLNLSSYLVSEIQQPYKKISDIFSKYNH